MIPSFSHDGVLPPFLPGGSPTESGAMSPYKVELAEFVNHYANTAKRIEILEGLIAYRDALRAVGVSSGFQWINGSFVEDCEKTRGRPPNDIDVVTFSVRPELYSTPEKWLELIHSNPSLFDPDVTKQTYKCDAYFVDLGVKPFHLVAQTSYWFGLFSHQRETFLWKGMIEVPLSVSDMSAEKLLKREDSNAS